MTEQIAPSDAERRSRRRHLQELSACACLLLLIAVAVWIARERFPSAIETEPPHDHRQGGIVEVRPIERAPIAAGTAEAR